HMGRLPDPCQRGENPGIIEVERLMENILLGTRGKTIPLVVFLSCKPFDNPGFRHVGCSREHHHVFAPS
ncbi:MAG TPA: hypothetical protein PLW83_10520, partial [Deltaproteobacteria bacterium]|nr:hypothetical protein [Deltaproteobacteria bacterium]